VDKENCLAPQTPAAEPAEPAVEEAVEAAGVRAPAACRAPAAPATPEPPLPASEAAATHQPRARTPLLEVLCNQQARLRHAAAMLEAAKAAQGR